MPILTFDLPLFLSPTSSLSSLLATTASVVLPIAHASNYLRMGLNSLKKVQCNFYLILVLQVYLVSPFLNEITKNVKAGLKELLCNNSALE